jgi:nifR3 family TIM-barrel protein
MTTPLQIGTISLESPFVQAALSGYSDSPMRVIARRQGAPYTLCEVMLDKFLVEIRKSRKNRHLIYVGDEEHPVGGQLMGAEPELFGPAAIKLVEAGFDVIDINFGCPVKKVLGRCRGGFHLSQPETAIEIIQRVRDHVPPEIPVTVKMRRGLDDTPESRERFFQIFDAARSIGVAAVTVHGRTVTQRYIGPSNWEILREIKARAGSNIILGSGDLFDARACVEMMKFTGVDGVTVARGAIGNPWVFGQAKALASGLPVTYPSLHEQRRVIAEHLRLSVEHYGPVKACRHMRKFGIRYAELHPEFLSLRDAFIKVSTPEDWEGILDRWYAEDLPGCPPPVEEPNPVCA